MKTLLVFGEKTFRITIPDDAKVTFGPFSPPTRGEQRGFGGPDRAVGTLRIYGRTKDEILAVFAGVRGFRDETLDYMEEIAKEEGATIWKSDEKGYVRESKTSGTREWIAPQTPSLPAGEDGPF